MRRGALVPALLACLVVAAADAAPPADAWLEGYAAAILRSRFNLTAPSLRVASGDITVSATDLGGIDPDQVQAALKEIPGATTVKIVTGPVSRGEWLPGG